MCFVFTAEELLNLLAEPLKKGKLSHDTFNIQSYTENPLFFQWLKGKS
jgi:hypothetical protein